MITRFARPHYVRTGLSGITTALTNEASNLQAEAQYLWL